MRFFFTPLLFLVLAACHSPREGACPLIASASEWAMAKATLFILEKQKGHYLVSISYPVPESTTLPRRDQRKSGIVEHRGTIVKKPQSPQIVCVRYLKSDPDIFVYMHPIKF